MESSSDVVTGVGVDYLTVTQAGRCGDSSLQGFGRYLVESEMKRGERERNFAFSGYRGLHAGSASFGIRHDGALLRISSKVAQEHWAQAYSLSTNVTRLDVQVTVRPSDGLTTRLSNHHESLLSRKGVRGRPAKFKFWYGPNGPEAAILGKRVSDWFGRVYDKGLESGLPEYAGCLRYEAETKRHVAKNLCAKLDQSETPEAEIAAVVSKFFSIRGCAMGPLSWQLESGAGAEYSYPLVFRNGQISLADLNIHLGEGRARRQSVWLYNAVRPCVQRLIALGQRELVMELLGLMEGATESMDHRTGLDADFNTWR